MLVFAIQCSSQDMKLKNRRKKRHDSSSNLQLKHIYYSIS